ncbi:hypothetical protein ACIQU6_30535 [Streptomyces sp. NPDC090442]|uniref:hypothetical protein n=1 Tax=Streptomyces sp. NPDC090442 TaxID=3365962 RepID=UPI0038193E4B
MDSSNVTDQKRTAAEQLLAGRLAVIDQLQAADEGERQAEDAARKAREHKAKVWQDAIKAGWSESELTGPLRFKRPAVKAPGRPRGSATKPAPAPRSSPESS